jgi:hypothetical protein
MAQKSSPAWPNNLPAYVYNRNGNTVREPDILRWGLFFTDDRNRILRKDTLPGRVVVSTVFLGLDYNLGRAPLLLWETTISGGTPQRLSEAHATRAEALARHEEALRLARQAVQ